MTLKEHLNLDASDELHMFMKTSANGKTTGKMKYDAFIKNMLTKLRPMMGEFLQAQEPVIKACETVEQLAELKIPALPDNVRDEIIALIDKQKTLDIVEKTYLCLDAFRAVSNNLANAIGKMCMQWGALLQPQEQSRIIQPRPGKIIIP